MRAKDLEKLSKEEYDVDTGTYMEDVHANDSIIGRDADSDGLVDDVERLVQEAAKRAEKYNAEKERERSHEQQQQQQEEKVKDDAGMGL